MKKATGLVYIFILFLSVPAWSQLNIYRIQDTKTDQHKARYTGSAKVSQDHLNLPFWEDFSKSTDSPDTVLWSNSENVLINNGLSFTPPSLNVASFDGLDAQGQPYGAGSNGQVDSLSSRRINLSGYSFADEIYMSFFSIVRRLRRIPAGENRPHHPADRQSRLPGKRNSYKSHQQKNNRSGR
ncbi:MAG: hypothetical protein P8X57_11620, partial [Cyclobacteriaceae bacterium]